MQVWPIQLLAAWQTLQAAGVLRTEASWQRIFDLNWSTPEIASPKAAKQIQGVTWEITLAQVSKVQAFVAR